MGRKRKTSHFFELTALLLLALALRLPQLQTIPRYTDETGEVATAMAIAFEGERPLVHNDAYRGPAWAYGLAALLVTLGPLPGLPRFYALTIGLLTVAAVHGLGRAVGGRRAGLFAGFLMATAFSPVALESHVAWSNHATALAVTMAATATWLAAGGGREDTPGRPTPTQDRWLLAAGLLWGLALQTHPSVLAPLTGIGLWFLLSVGVRACSRRPAAWLALILFALSLSSLFIYNLERYADAGELASVAEATADSQPINRDLGPAALTRNGLGLVGQLGRAAGAGRPEEPGEPSPSARVALTDALRPLATLVYAMLLLIAFARAARKGPRMIAAMGWAGVLILPLVNRNYQSFYDMRYLGFLLPLGFVALAIWLDEISPPSADHDDGAATRATKGSSLGSSLIWRPWLLLLVLGLYAQLNVWSYFERERAAGRTNAPLIAATEILDGAWEASAPGSAQQIWVDKAMRPIKLEGGGDPTRAFGQLLRLRELPFALSDESELRWFLQNDHSTRYWIFAADGTAEGLKGEGHPLDAVSAGDGWQLLRRSGEGED